MPRRTTFVAIVLSAVLGGACAGSGSTAEPAPGGVSEIEIVMSDKMTYTPDAFTVQAGQTVRFTFVNEGAIAHDAFIGDAAAQDEHEEEMASGMGHEGTSDEPAVTVEPGQRATLEYTFDEAGELIIGCHQPGHYAAGMQATVAVE